MSLSKAVNTIDIKRIQIDFPGMNARSIRVTMFEAYGKFTLTKTSPFYLNAFKRTIPVSHYIKRGMFRKWNANKKSFDTQIGLRL